MQQGRLRFQFALDVNGDSLALRKVTPTRTCEFDHLLNDFTDVHLGQLFIIRAAAIEFPHAGDDLSYVSARLIDGLQVMLRDLRQIRQRT